MERPVAFGSGGGYDAVTMNVTTFMRSTVGRPAVATLVTGVLLSLPSCAPAREKAANDTAPAAPVDEAARLSEETKANPGDAELQYRLGNALFDKGLYRDAAAAYEQALALRPEYAAAHCNLGLSLRRLGRLQEAIQSYRRALQYEPDDPVTLRNLAAAEREAGNAAGAIEHLRRLTGLAPEDVLVRSELANLLFQLKQYPEAAESFKEVIRLDPGMSSDYYNLGLCYLEMDNLDSALTTWLTALAYDPNNASARKGLAVAYWRRGDYDQSWQAVVECQTRGIPLDPDFMDKLRTDSGRVGP